MSAVPSPSSTTKSSSSAEWQCGGQFSIPGGTVTCSMPVRSEPAAVPRSRRTLATVSPVNSCTGTSSTFTIEDGRGRSSPSVGAPAATSRFHGWFSSAPDSTQLAPSHDDARARQVGGRVGVRAHPEREHVEPVGARVQRVRLLERQMDEAVARARSRARSPSPSPPPRGATPPTRRARRRSPPRRPRDGAASTTCRDRPGSAADRR